MFRKIDNYYLWGIKGIIFLMPFIPLCVTPSLVFPYITGKNFAFRILVEFAAALWAGLISINKEYRLRNSAIMLSILIFTFIVGLADLLGVSPYNSFWSNYERMEGYITILHLAVYFMIVKSVLRTKRDWMIFFNIFVVVSVFVSIFALTLPVAPPNSSQFSVIYGSRVYGTIGNPPFLASYLLLSIFFGFILILNTQRRYLKFVYLLLIIINSIAIYFTASRGAILAAVIGTLMFILFHIFVKTSFPKEKPVKKAVLSLITILIVFSVAFLTFKNAEFMKHDRTLSRFVTMFSDDSVQNRFVAWKFAWEGIKERPVLGWGQENFIGVYSVNPIPFVSDEQMWIDRAHNIVMDWLINAGILGLFSYLAILGTAFYILWTVFQQKIISENEVFTIAAALAAYFIHNLFTFDTINTYLLFFTLLAYIDNVNYTKKAPDLTGPIDSIKIGIKSISITLAALLSSLFMFYYLNYKPIRESQLYVNIIKSSSENNSYSNLLDQFNNALSLGTFGDAYVRQGMSSISFISIRNKYFTHEGALKFIETTARELEKGLASNSHNLEYLTNVIMFYNEGAFYEPSFIAKTEALIRECMRLNPDYQWLYMALADIYVMKKNYEGAFINVKKVTDWDPQNDKKQLKLALAAIYTSRHDVVKSSLENVKKIRAAENKNIASGREAVFSAAELYQLARVYTEIKNLHEALQYYNELITLLSYEDKLYSIRDFRFRKPEKKAQIHYEIAKIYLALGDKENAAREAKKASEPNPENIVR